MQQNQHLFFSYHPHAMRIQLRVGNTSRPITPMQMLGAPYVYGPTDEADRMDECLVPHDFDWTPEHAVTDKQFLNLYSQLPYDSHFAAIFDCCHSGGMTCEGARKARGITPPDDIRHRALRWNAELKMWEDRPYASPNPSLAEKGDTSYLGSSGASHRIGRAISLRSMAKKQYDATSQNAQTQRLLPAHHSRSQPGGTASLRIPAWQAIVWGVYLQFGCDVARDSGEEG